MKQNNIKRYLTWPIISLLTFIAAPLQGSAQFIENKVDIQLGASLGGLNGPSTINENGFILPSLFGNFYRYYGYGLKANYQVQRKWSVGAGVSLRQSGNWSYLEDNTYEGSANTQQVLSIHIRVHNGFSALGIFNRVKFYAELAPEIGLSLLKLRYPIVFAYGENFPMRESTAFFGLKATTGIQAIIAPRVGFFLAISYHESWINGLLFNDKRFGGHQLEGGFFFRLSEDKRFYL